MTPTTETAVLVSLEPTSRAQLETERQALLARPLPTAPTTADEYAQLAAEQARVQAFIKRVEPEFDAVCDAAYKTWKRATGLRSLFFEGLHAFNDRARQLLGAFKADQDRIKREAELRILEEERRAAEERRFAEACALEQQGHQALAAAVLETEIPAGPSVTLPSRVPEVPGLHFQTAWRWRIAGATGADGGRKDKARRKRAAAVVPRAFLDLDDAAITAHVTHMRDTVKIPGIEIYSEQVPVRR
jgi:hypothetical protein